MVEGFGRRPFVEATGATTRRVPQKAERNI